MHADYFVAPETVKCKYFLADEEMLTRMGIWFYSLQEALSHAEYAAKGYIALWDISKDSPKNARDIPNILDYKIVRHRVGHPCRIFALGMNSDGKLIADKPEEAA